MPGSPSRTTFDQSKSYDNVLFIGGTGRRLFDAELNEAQQIEADFLQRAYSSLVGNNDYENNTGTMIDLGGNVTPNVSAHTVNIQGGYLCAAGQVVRFALPGSQTAVAVFTGGDAPGLQAVIYVDVFLSTVDSTVDPNIIDPTYGIECAQRTKLNFVISVVKGTGTLPSPGSGHCFVLLAVVTNNHSVLLPSDIVPGPAIESQSALTSSVTTQLTAFETSIDAALATKLSYHAIPYSLSHANTTGIAGFTGDSSNYDYYFHGSPAVQPFGVRTTGDGAVLVTPPSILAIPSTAQIINVKLRFQPVQNSGNFYSFPSSIPFPSGVGALTVSANPIGSSIDPEDTLFCPPITPVTAPGVGGAGMIQVGSRTCIRRAAHSIPVWRQMGRRSKAYSSSGRAPTSVRTGAWRSCGRGIGPPRDPRIWIRNGTILRQRSRGDRGGTGCGGKVMVSRSTPVTRC